MERKLTPAARHMARVAAASAATLAAAQQGTMADATVYEQHLAKLYQDRSRLKNIASTQGKVALKKQLLDGYDDYVKGVLESGAGVQDEVFTTIMLWAIDAEQYEQALLMAEYVLEHELKLADRFERPPATMVAEEIATSALNKLKADKPFDLGILEAAEKITRSHDMHDQARAKIHLAIGKALLLGFDEENVTEEAVVHLHQAKMDITRAIELHDKCGGKKDLEKIERLLKKHAAPVEPEPGTGETPPASEPDEKPAN
ncbi:MAG: phage terminase small subunit [Pseudomonadaceae bacterium]